MFHALNAYPLATASSAAFYVVLILLAVPATRVHITPLFTHPVPPRQQYLLGFDTLRGFAAALVALGHCWWATYPVFAATQLQLPWLAYGAKGVPIFCVLSGFLIYRSALGGMRSIEAFRSYAIRRFFRIYPVYLFSIILCLIAGQYVGGPHTSRLSYFLSDVFMLDVLQWPGGFALPPAWSLYIEVAFYAFLPFLVLVTPRRWIVPVSLAGIAILIAADYESRIFALWKYFLAGIVASELSPHLNKRLAIAILLAGLALLVIDFQSIDYDWVARLGIGRLHQDTESIGLGIACALILAALPSLPRIGAALNVAPLRMIGVISYSVYLIHFFYIKANFPEIGLFTGLGSQLMYKHFLTLPAAPAWYMPFVFFPGILFWGCVTFLLVERPGLQLGRYLVKRGQPAGGVVPAE